MFKNLGPMELGIILVIVVMIFGVGKLPQVGSAIGKSIRAFKQSQAGDDEDEAVEETPKTKKRKTTKKVVKADSIATKATTTVTEKPVVDKTQSA